MVKRVAHWLCGILLACTALLFSQTAEATHFRYGNVTWRLPDPTNAPLTVEFTVTTGWRFDFVNPTTQLQFGDATSAPSQAGAIIGGGVDATGLQYTIRQYQVTHTYAAPGVYTAFFQGGDRIADLENAGNDLYRVEATVALDATGTNTSGPVSGIPVIIQFEVDSVNQFILPVFDPDADPHTCRFSTQAESEISGANPPQLPLFGDTLHFIAPGCSIEWDDTGLIGATVGDRYAVSIAVESTHNGVVSKTTVDYIIEWVPANTKPTCTGGGNFTASVGMPFTQNVLGSDPQGGNLTLTANGLPAGSTTIPGVPATQPQPFNGTFNWTPGVGDAGQSYLIQFTYTDATNISDTCTLIVEVPQCAGFGDPCTVGIGACMNTGTIVCQGANPVCSVSPFPPGPVEICGNVVDEDCDGDFNDADACPDTDGDGVIDEVEIQIGSDPNDQDSDDDGVGDGDEPGPCLHSASCFDDTDGDGLVNVLDPDSDNDGLLDGTEMGFDCSGAGTDAAAQSCTPDGDAGATVTDPLDADTDDGGVTDGSEDSNLNGVIDGGETIPTAGNGADDADPANTDSDGDGLSDDFENNLGTDPNDQDSDDDGVLDGQEPNPSLDTDGDGLINPLDPDSDNDGLYDGTEMGFGCASADTDPGPPVHCTPDGDGGATTTSPLDWDTDNGGASDGSEDQDLDGVIDAGETDPTAGNGADDGDAGNTDTDGDGLSDGLETFLGSDPADGDSDDDGVLDGFEPNPADDTDGDGLANVLDVDSDDDGLYDGTELGFDCSEPDTDPGPPAHCFADGDAGATMTSPLLWDTDGGGVSDGSEDADLDGALDAGELDPLASADDAGAIDSDGDGLSDELELFLGSDPNDADTDDDGLLDGDEHNPSDHNDSDMLINLLDVDSDDDGLADGTEDGQDCDNPDTAIGHCVFDADPTTTTSPLKKDTDGGGASDGSEDSNLNGAVDGTETNPTAGNGADDGDAINVDTDGDGLSDALETFIGSNPDDADSDDDGLPDSDENNPADDMNGDGDNNIADPDSDGDGLFDGTEKGNDCEDPATDPAANNCVADADGGATTTNHLDADTDDGGIDDGEEDANHNGMIDGGETDPNDPSDDAPAPECTDDEDCPPGEICDTITMMCEPDGTGGAGGGGGTGGDGIGGSGLTGGDGSGGAGGDAADGLLAVGGCDCNVPHRDNDAPWVLFAAGALAVFTRRRRSSLERAS